jgi:hypothetical protein
LKDVVGKYSATPPDFLTFSRAAHEMKIRPQEDLIKIIAKKEVEIQALKEKG